MNDKIINPGELTPSVLIDLMKNRSLSVEQLKEIIPMTNEFISGLCNALVAEIQSGKDSHITALKTLEESIKTLGEIGKVENCSEEIKVLVIEKISEIARIIYEMQRVHGNNSFKFLYLILGCLFTIVISVLIPSGSKSQEK